MITISDYLIVLATLLSPVIAVQVQKWIERATERRLAQRQVFYDLMATRATRIAPKHVEALNRIDLEFNKGRAKERDVLNRWRIYADHLNQQLDENNHTAITQWNIQSDELFTDLLQSISIALGYPFDRVQLKRGIYYPRAHGKAEQRREIFEEAVVDLLLGNRALNMSIVEFPHSEDAANLSRRLQERIITAISEDGVLKTKQVD